MQADPFLDLAETLTREREARVYGRFSAALMLARDWKTVESIVLGVGDPDWRVRRERLDGLVLQRAYRGRPVPAGDGWIHVTLDMLDAIDEAGPIR